MGELFRDSQHFNHLRISEYLTQPLKRPPASPFANQIEVVGAKPPTYMEHLYLADGNALTSPLRQGLASGCPAKDSNTSAFQRMLRVSGHTEKQSQALQSVVLTRGT